MGAEAIFHWDAKQNGITISESELDFREEKKHLKKPRPKGKQSTNFIDYFMSKGLGWNTDRGLNGLYVQLTESFRVL